MADVIDELFSFFCPIWRTVLKTFVGNGQPSFWVVNNVVTLYNNQRIVACITP